MDIGTRRESLSADDETRANARVVGRWCKTRGRPDFRAGPRDWRTAPLWGIGLRQQVNGSSHLLHDGRARNVTEAILWHGGEAQDARDRFAGFSREEREALLAFVNAI